MIVLCYAPEDMIRVEGFYRALHEAGLEPWMDSKDRPPGALWERALSVAVRRSDLLIVFLSEHSVDKHGLLQKELIQALGDWEKKGADDLYVVVARLEACKVPDQLANFQRFEALHDLKTPQLVKLLRVLHGKATGKLNFLPTRLEYNLREISPESSTHCDISVTIPQFDAADNDLLTPAATRSLISIEFYISTYRRGDTKRQHYTRTLNIDVEHSSELFLREIVKNQATAILRILTQMERS
jgi:hypothetical protein